MSQQADLLKKKVAESQKTLQDALVLVDTTSKEQDKKMKGLEQVAKQLKAVKLAAEEEVSKEKKAAENSSSILMR